MLKSVLDYYTGKPVELHNGDTMVILCEDPTHAYVRVDRAHERKNTRPLAGHNYYFDSERRVIVSEQPDDHAPHPEPQDF